MTQEARLTLTEKDWIFIRQMNGRFPEKNIAANFSLFSRLPPEERIALAKEWRKKVLRTGWNRRGVPTEETETLEEHVLGMQAMAQRELKGHEKLPEILLIIDVHDDAEAIIGDFISLGADALADPLTKDEKSRLEVLASQVIHEKRPDLIALCHDYAEARTPAGLIVKDLDKLQMYERYLIYLKTHPHLDFSDFDRHCRGYHWKTAEGLAIYRKLTA